MARNYKILIIVILSIGFLMPLSSYAWVTKHAKDKVHYRIPFKPKWVSRLKKGAFYKYKRRELSSPIAAEGLILVGVDSGYFYAFDQEDGDKKWRFKAEGPINATAAAGQGKVFFGDDDGNFYALDIKTGDLIWKERYGSLVTTSPLIIGDRLYIVNIAGTVLALQAETGHRIWSYPYQPPKREMTMLGQGSLAHSVDKKGDRLYVGFSDGRLVAVDANGGSIIWSQNLARSQRKFIDVDMQPLIDGDRIYAATFGGDLFCLNRNDGNILWEVAIGSGVRFSLSGDVLFVSGSDGVLYALGKEDGAERWKYESKEGALTRPIVYNDLVMVGSTKHSMFFIDALNGNKILQRFARKNIYSDPILAGEKGNLLVYLSNSGRLYALLLKESFR